MNVDVTGVLVVALIVYMVKENKEVRRILNGMISYLNDWVEK